MAVERKYERDIDLLLAEEFAVSEPFASWFLMQTRFAGVAARVVDVYVSRSDVTGESDLVVVFEETTGNARFALLMEDKIDAPLQPEQAERYHRRAESEMARGDYGDFEVVLCSPEVYRAAQSKASSFGRFISYEAISAFLRDQDRSARGAYRSNFIATAASKSVNSWTKIDDEVTNTFWEAAYELAAHDFPTLEMKPLNVTKDSTWINFRPADLPTRPQRIYVSFKGDRGFMDLTFTGSSLHAFQPKVEQMLEPDMTIHQTGKSAAIRIRVEGFQVSEPWEKSRGKVKSAFTASERLIQFYRRHREALDQAAAASIAERY